MALQARKLSSLKLTHQAQPREKIDLDIIGEYEEFLKDHPDKDLPPITVFGNYVADGFHRYMAYQSAERKTIPAIVHEGGQRQAVLYSCGANATHGLRRTNADKRRAVKKMLADPEWSKWSDHRIAETCQVSQPFVSSQRGDNAYHLKEETRIGRDSKEYTLKAPPPPKPNRDPSLKRILSAICLLAKSDPETFMAGLSEPQRERLLGGNPSELIKARQFLDSL